MSQIKGTGSATVFGKDSKVLSSHYVELADIPGSLDETLNKQEIEYVQEKRSLEQMELYISEALEQKSSSYRAPIGGDSVIFCLLNRVKRQREGLFWAEIKEHKHVLPSLLNVEL